MFLKRKKIYFGKIVALQPYLDTSFNTQVLSLRLVIRTNSRLFDCYKYDYSLDFQELKPGDLIEFEFVQNSFLRMFEPAPHELASIAYIKTEDLKLTKAVNTLAAIKNAFDEIYKTDNLTYSKCPNEYCFSSKVFDILKTNGLIEQNCTIKN